MDTDQIKGKLQNAFGKAEEAVGKAIGNQNLVNAGTEDRVKGAATETWGNAKDTVRGAKDTAHTETTAAGDRTAGGAESLRDSINAKLDNVQDHDAARRRELNSDL